MEKHEIDLIKKLSDWFLCNEWQVESQTGPINFLDNRVLSQYQLPASFICFLEYFKRVISKDDTTWFICYDDYSDESEDSFRWNEFERMSLEAADGDDTWKKQIADWWNNRLPIVMSVESGYSYYAIDLNSPSGMILYGEEPEFEEASVVAENFEEFVEQIISGRIVL